MLSKQIYNEKLAWLICGMAALFYCYAYFLRVSPSVMMTQLIDRFHIDAASFGVLSTFYYFAYAPMQLPVGILLDKYGARLMMFLACLVCVVGVLIFIVADNLFIAATGRFLIGLGSAFSYIAVLKIASNWLPSNRFATAAGLTTSFGMLAAIFSDNYLTHIVDSIGYQNALYSALVAGVILCISIGLIIRDHPTKSQNNAFSTHAPTKRIKQGIMMMLKSRQMLLIGIIGALLYLPASVFLDLWGIPYFKSVYQLSPSQAASVISMVFIGWIVSSPLIGMLSDKLKRRRLPLTTASILAALTISLVFLNHSLSIPTLYILMLLFGIFCGSHPLCFSLSKETNPAELSATATAVTNFFIMLGGMIFQPLVGLLIEWHWNGAMQQHIPLYSASDFSFALTIIPIALIIASGLSLWVKETASAAPNFFTILPVNRVIT